jgi:hypothetical protein
MWKSDVLAATDPIRSNEAHGRVDDVIALDPPWTESGTGVGHTETGTDIDRAESPEVRLEQPHPLLFAAAVSTCAALRVGQAPASGEHREAHLRVSLAHARL